MDWLLATAQFVDAHVDECFWNLQTTLYQQRFHELSDNQRRSIKNSAIGYAARDSHGVADQGELEPPFAAASSGKNRLAQKLKQIAQHADDNVWGLSRRMGAKIRHFGKRTVAGWRRAEENGVRMSTSWSTIFGEKKQARFARCRSTSDRTSLRTNAVRPGIVLPNAA
jgi:hypothetical protein